MDTALADQAVLKLMRGPTCTRVRGANDQQRGARAEARGRRAQATPLPRLSEIPTRVVFSACVRIRIYYQTFE